MLGRPAAPLVAPALSGPALAATTPSGTTTGVASQYGVSSFVLVAVVVIAALWYWRWRHASL